MTISKPFFLYIYRLGVSFEQVRPVYDEIGANHTRGGMRSPNLKSGGVFKRIIIKYYDPASQKE